MKCKLDDLETANEKRIGMARAQRMEKTQKKWLEWCSQFKNRKRITGLNGVSVGDSISFVKSRSVGSCYQISQKEGLVFALSDKGDRVAVVCCGKIEYVNNPEKQPI